MTRSNALVLGAILGMCALVSPLSAQNGLVARWTFDETSGSVIHDVSGNGFHGVAYGSSPANGVLEGARAFTEPSFVGVPNQNSVPQQIANLSVGSISVWFRVDSVDPASSLRPILYLGNNDISPNDEAIVLEVGHGAAGGSFLYFTYYLHGSTPLCFDSDFDLSIGEWHHVVITVGPNSNTGYLDGVEMVNRDYNAGGPTDRAFFSDVPNPAVLWFGTGYAKELPELRYHEGLIDELHIYDRALTATEVETLWLLGIPQQPFFVRGDTNRDGSVDIADPIATLGALFGGAPIGCESSADSNDDGALDISDAIHSLGGIFGTGPQPTAPFPACGTEPTVDSLGCLQPTC